MPAHYATLCHMRFAAPAAAAARPSAPNRKYVTVHRFGSSLAGTPLRSGSSAAAVAPAQRRRSGVMTQANLFARVARIIKSYTNSAISAAEDPEKILDQAVEDMQNDLIKLRQAAAQVKASQKRLENKYTMAQTNADEWYRRAELALSKGDEELAREALTRRKTFQDNANMLRGQLEQQSKAVDTLVGNMRMLEDKLAEAKMKKETLKARVQSAKSARAISDLVAGLDTSNAVSAFEKMEEKVLAMESEAEAAQLLVAPDNLESRFRELEGSDVDDELSQLKRSLADKRPAGQLPPGRRVTDAIDVELNDMRRRMQ